MGQAIDEFSGIVGRGAGYGAAAGALNAGADLELGDVPSSALRGAIGGAIGAPIGRAVTRGIAASHIKPLTKADLATAGDIGVGVGGLGGGYIMSKAPPGTVSQLTRPSDAALAEA